MQSGKPVEMGTAEAHLSRLETSTESPTTSATCHQTHSLQGLSQAPRRRKVRSGRLKAGVDDTRGHIVLKMSMRSG